jgi:large subunit ribosomal protein L15
MRLNTISPAKGSNHTNTRVGRGIGSGKGKTAGRGHKGQHARSGGYHKVGFEGGQMPMARRLPKRGFKPLKYGSVKEIRLSELNLIDGGLVSLESLKAAGIVPQFTIGAKVIKSGALNEGKKFQIQGIKVTKGARAVIEAAGGQIEE